MSHSVGTQWEQVMAGRDYAPAYNAGFLKRFRRSPYIAIALRYARLPPASRVLEPGCGSGKFGLAFASLGNHVVILDYLAHILRKVRDTERGLGDVLPRQLQGYCQGDLESLPFPSDGFDLVINEGVVEHWLDDELRVRVLREMVRVTRPNGVVAVIVPNGAHPHARRWVSSADGCGKAPPMVFYSTARLAQDLEQAGLREVCVDGIYAWRSWVRLHPWNRLYKVAAILDHLVPLPKPVRESWAINVIGLGRKGGAG